MIIEMYKKKRNILYNLTYYKLLPLPSMVNVKVASLQITLTSINTSFTSNYTHTHTHTQTSLLPLSFSLFLYLSFSPPLLKSLLQIFIMLIMQLYHIHCFNITSINFTFQRHFKTTMRIRYES